jgi:2-oxoglutarate dehydrogenase E2 component (dihydrolipoamide succinyltransferase)
MEYATVTGWLKSEGERVSADEPVVEVEADKANHEIAAPVEGVIREILAVEGDEVKVGSVLAIIEEEG